jgi:hypothetical protein
VGPGPREVSPPTTRVHSHFNAGQLAEHVASSPGRAPSWGSGGGVGSETGWFVRAGQVTVAQQRKDARRKRNRELALDLDRLLRNSFQHIRPSLRKRLQTRVKNVLAGKGYCKPGTLKMFTWQGRAKREADARKRRGNFKEGELGHVS